MYYFSLQIFASDEKIDDINLILGVNANNPNAPGWSLEITNQDVPHDSNFIDYFLSILEGKYDSLSEIGISTNDISVWMLYEYEQQCNMELTPEIMYKLGSKGITYCISCWEKDSVIDFEESHVVDSRTWHAGVHKIKDSLPN